MKKLSKQSRILMSIVAIFVITIVFAIAYAAFSQTLNITGSGVVRNSSWNIHFVTDSLYVNNGYLKPSNTLSSSTKILSDPSISNTTIGDYSVSLTTPGDTVVYTFDVINEGDYNAKITDFNLPSPSCTGTGESKVLDEVKVCGGEYNSETYQRQIEYTLKYVDGTPVSNNDPLLSKETKTMVLTLTYKEFNDASLLPSNDITLDHLSFTIKYVQDGSALVNNDGSTPYVNLYALGRQITVAGESYHIISSNVDDDYVVALKDNPLSVSEVDLYGGVGTDHNHVNKYCYPYLGSCDRKTEDKNGYGGVLYFSDAGCNNGGNGVTTSCSSNYDSSDIKYIVDEWASAKFTNELKEVDGYKSRLIKFDELVPKFDFKWGQACQWCSETWQKSANTPDWLCSGDYGYWTMTQWNENTSKVWTVGSTTLSSSGVGNEAVRKVVRPVINVYKSAIQS